jgi:transcriptional regulator with XRE-family HTH domain
MANERLRAALLRHELSAGQLADDLGVDRKTVERWITGRVPFRRHRYAIARRLDADEAYLWPEALAPSQVAEASESEILSVYPHRWTVPRDEWVQLFAGAEREIGVLVYSGLFLADDAGIRELFREKAAAGVRLRVLLGDTASTAVRERGRHEGIDEALIAKIRNVVVLFSPLFEVEGIEFRRHGAVLYNSIYRADEEMLVNTHVYGAPASQAPVLRLRRVAGGTIITTYLESFERVWTEALPLP